MLHMVISVSDQVHAVQWLQFIILPVWSGSRWYCFMSCQCVNNALAVREGYRICGFCSRRFWNTSSPGCDVCNMHSTNETLDINTQKADGSQVTSVHQFFAVPHNIMTVHKTNTVQWPSTPPSSQQHEQHIPHKHQKISTTLYSIISHLTVYCVSYILWIWQNNSTVISKD